jgi:predicted nucleic acid-binding protein
MKAFLDTSVLIATFYGDHEHHEPSLDLFLRFNKTDVGCAAHSLAEVYASLTGMPVKWRVSCDTALLFLNDIREKLTLITLNELEYFQTLEAAAAANLGSGTIYDALLGQCALKAEAEVLYTWNTRDFLRLPTAIAGLIRIPGESGKGDLGK